MRFVETPIFTREVSILLDDEEYRALQMALVLRPEQGRLIPGGAGLRKIRWALGDRGKRAGCRVIYYWSKTEETIYMLLAYRKSKQEDLTPAQLECLRRLVRRELR